MSRKCELTGVGPTTGNLVSHSNIKTRTRWLPNVKKKQYAIPELGQTITVMLSSRAMRTVDKLGGLVPALFWAKEDKMSAHLLKLRNQISKKAKAATKKGQKAAAKA